MQGLVPQKILKRNNMGLEMPHSLWFFGKLGAIKEKYFSRKNIEKSGLFSYDAVMELWHEHTSFKRDNGRALWSLLMFMIWFDLFVYNGNFKEYLKK